MKFFFFQNLERITISQILTKLVNIWFQYFIKKKDRSQISWNVSYFYNRSNHVFSMIIKKNTYSTENLNIFIMIADGSGIRIFEIIFLFIIFVLIVPTSWSRYWYLFVSSMDWDVSVGFDVRHSDRIGVLLEFTLIKFLDREWRTMYSKSVDTVIAPISNHLQIFESHLKIDIYGMDVKYVLYYIHGMNDDTINSYRSGYDLIVYWWLIKRASHWLIRISL